MMDSRYCANCNIRGTVYETRNRPGGSTRRRYKCIKCGERWSTVEYYDHKIIKEEPKKHD